MPVSIECMKPDQLVAALVKAGWSQERIAIEADVTQPTISRIFSKRHRDPRYSVVERLRTLVRQTQQVAQ